jgi:uncharacterized membrane protein YgcG
MFWQLNWQRVAHSLGFADGTSFASCRRVASAVRFGRASSKRWWVSAAAAVMLSCLSPTMPMPPPSKPDIEGPDEHGVVTLSGYAPADSLVYADNVSTNLSYGQRTDPNTGLYRFPILASVGDQISMFYRLDTEDSMRIGFQIPTFSAFPRDSGTHQAGAGQAGSNQAGTSGMSGGFGGTGGFAGAGY